MKKKNSNVYSLKKKLDKKIKTQKIYTNFKLKLEKIIKKKPFVVAVSGGPDSLALAALSKTYKDENNSKTYFVLVDHGIRKNSEKEASSIKKLLKKSNINLNIIKNKKKIEKNIQGEARKIRYKLILDFCKKNKVSYILTAHHSDDQVETFLIRLSRGSGVQGLSSMKNLTKLNNKVKLFRPLLNLKKKDLEFTTKHIFKRFIHDPSNKDEKFLRTRIRNLVTLFEKSGIHHDQIIKSINNLADTRDTLDKYFKITLKACVKKHKNKIIIDIKKLNIETLEIRLKVLSHVLKVFSKSYYPPRSKKVINLIKQFAIKDRTKLTLGGCILQKSGNDLIITKEMVKKGKISKIG
jgi:tRNA(Ile)-lysidine synthase